MKKQKINSDLDLSFEDEEEEEAKNGLTREFTFQQQHSGRRKCKAESFNFQLKAKRGNSIGRTKPKKGGDEHPMITEKGIKAAR